MTHKIDRLTIRGFQSIRTLEDFPLGDLNILIGSNGAGKSNFIAFFRMLTELVEKRLQLWVNKRGGADRVLSFGVKETPQLSAELWFGQNHYGFTLEPTDGDDFVFADEFIHYTEKYEQGLSIGVGHRESRLKDEVPAVGWNVAAYCYAAISSWKVYHFHDTSDSAGAKKRGSLDDVAYLRSDAANLAAFLYHLRREFPDVYAEVRKVVQLAIPFFDDFVLTPETLNENNQQVRLLWRQQDSDYPLWASQLSDGSLRFICLVTALLQPNPPATLIIDEPELGLHPYALTLLGALLRAESSRMQIIVSTQSVALVNEFSLDELVITERENGATIFKRLDEADFALWLADYAPGELWSKNLLGGRP